jgi:hypothetical protein
VAENTEPRGAEPAPAESRRDDLLDLTAQPADIVTIDDERYDMARLTALPLRTQAELQRIFTRLDALQKLEEPSEADEREYEQRLRRVAEIALPGAPAATLARLDLEQLRAVANGFFVRSFARAPLPREMQRLERNLDGASSFPSSRRSTAETP